MSVVDINLYIYSVTCYVATNDCVLAQYRKIRVGRAAGSYFLTDVKQSYSSVSCQYLRSILTIITVRVSTKHKRVNLIPLGKSLDSVQTFGPLLPPFLALSEFTEKWGDCYIESCPGVRIVIQD